LSDGCPAIEHIKRAAAGDMDHVNMPISPVGEPTELHLLTQAMVFGYTRYPNAAKEYLRFLWERGKYEPWQQAAIGYVTQPLMAYGDNPVWTEDPKRTPFRDVVKKLLWSGCAGDPGYASAAAMADCIVVNMFAAAASGDMAPRVAAEHAARRAERYWRI
jgi:multiple sugar transport system substrate-binding protein